VNQAPIVQMSSCNDLSRKTPGTPLGAIGRGLVAGAAGTPCDGRAVVRALPARRQTALLRLGVLLRPVQLGRGAGARASRQRLFEGLFQKKLPPKRAAAVSNITHWAYGMLNGAAYAIAAESLGQPRTWHGLPFGASVWAASYTPSSQPPGLYKPIRDYDRETLAKGPQRPPRLWDHYRRRRAPPVALTKRPHNG